MELVETVFTSHQVYYISILNTIVYVNRSACQWAELSRFVGDRSMARQILNDLLIIKTDEEKGERIIEIPQISVINLTLHVIY